MELLNLDETTRRYMLEEVELDDEQGTLYLSPRLSEHGQASYRQYLEEAIVSGDDGSLADALAGPGVLNEHEWSHRKGKPYQKRVPVNAPETLAEGEFNRFYLRGLARRAIEDGSGALVIYRAKVVEHPRPDSEAKVGQRIAADQLLADLRAHQGVDTALGLPPGPNSGLSAHLTDEER